MTPRHSYVLDSLIHPHISPSPFNRKCLYVAITAPQHYNITWYIEGLSLSSVLLSICHVLNQQNHIKFLAAKLVECQNWDNKFVQVEYYLYICVAEHTVLQHQNKGLMNKENVYIYFDQADKKNTRVVRTLSSLADQCGLHAVTVRRIFSKKDVYYDPDGRFILLRSVLVKDSSKARDNSFGR